MLRVIFIGAVILVGLVVGPVIIGQQGYLLIALGGYTIETSVTTAVVVAIVFFMALLLVKSILGRILFARRRFRHWWHRRRQMGAVKQTQNGMLAMTEGNYSKAERLIIKGAKTHQKPLLNYLSAAQAAAQQGKIEQRDDYLRRAFEADPKAELSIGITQAKLLLQNGEQEKVLATLNQLYRFYPRNPEVLTLLQQVFIALGQWRDLLDLIPNLQKQRLCDEPKAQQLRAQAFTGLIDRFAHNKQSDEILNCWRTLTRKERYRTTILLPLCQRLSALGENSQVFALLKSAIDRQRDPLLMGLLGELILEDPKPLMKYLDKLQQAQSDAAVLRAKGMQLLRQGSPDKAATCFDALLSTGEMSAEDCLFLADISEQARLRDKAAGLYRRGLRLALGRR